MVLDKDMKVEVLLKVLEREREEGWREGGCMCTCHVYCDRERERETDRQTEST